MYYRVCPFCGVHLDPDEKCDCIDVGLPECITVAKEMTASEAAPAVK